MEILICSPDTNPAFSASTAVLTCMRGQTIAHVFQARQYNSAGQPIAPDEAATVLHVGGRTIDLTDPTTPWLAEWWLFLHAVYLLEQPTLLVEAQGSERFRDGVAQGIPSARWLHAQTARSAYTDQQFSGGLGHMTVDAPGKQYVPHAARAIPCTAGQARPAGCS